MREIVLIAVVLILCSFALVRPKIGLFAYIWFALMHPDVLAYSSIAVPYSFLLAGTTLLGSLAHLNQIPSIFANPITRWLIWLQIPIGISVMTAQLPSLSIDPYGLYCRVIVMALLTVVYVRTEKDLRRLILVIALSLGAIGAKYGLYGLVRGGIRYDSGFEGTFLSDNNTLALALTMVVPLCWYARSLVSRQWIKLILLGLVFLNTAAIVMTFSRGAALSLLTVFLLIMLRSEHRAGMLVILVAFSAPAIYMAGGAYFDRLATIQDPAHEASAASRLEHQQAAFAMWKDYPLFGVGFGTGNYVQLAPRYLGHQDVHVAHNTYLQMLADSGVFAFVIHTGLLGCALLWLGRSARSVRLKADGLEIYPYALQSSLAAFAVGSYFVSRVSFDLYYMLIAATASWYVVYQHWTQQGVSEESGESEKVTVEVGV